MNEPEEKQSLHDLLKEGSYLSRLNAIEEICEEWLKNGKPNSIETIHRIHGLARIKK